MNKALVIISVLVVIALAVIAGFLTGIFPWQHGTPSPTSSTVSQTAQTSQTAVSSPSPATPAILPSGANGSVRFAFEITNISGSGLSRTVTATLNNAGNIDAHNVWAKIQATSGGSAMKLNGQDYLRVDIGTLKTGETVTKQVTLNFGVFDGAKIMAQGVHLDLTIFSDEQQQAFAYDYKP